eukprot:COSAG06_NODE_208_length_20182_cov_31.214759_19_plen_120_part_00
MGGSPQDGPYGTPTSQPLQFPVQRRCSHVFVLLPGSATSRSRQVSQFGSSGEWQAVSFHADAGGGARLPAVAAAVAAVAASSAVAESSSIERRTVVAFNLAARRRFFTASETFWSCCPC